MLKNAVERLKRRFLTPPDLKPNQRRATPVEIQAVNILTMTNDDIKGDHAKALLDMVSHGAVATRMDEHGRPVVTFLDEKVAPSPTRRPRRKFLGIL